MPDWTRIPVEIDSDTDRRTLVSILAANGLEVRIVKERKTPSAPYKRYIEYRQQT